MKGGGWMHVTKGRRQKKEGAFNFFWEVCILVFVIDGLGLIGLLMGSY